MSISQDELKKIAEKLSKIPWDNPALLWNITDILGYMVLLSEVDTNWVIPTVSAVEHNAWLREDYVSNLTETTWTNLLGTTNQKIVANQIVLPNIMN